MAEAEIVEWAVKVGDLVKEDQVVAAVMTDKATVEIPTPVAGSVLALGGAVGDVLAVGAELIRIDAPGLPDSVLPRRRNRAQQPPEPTPTPRAKPEPPSPRRPSLALRSLRSRRLEGAPRPLDRTRARRARPAKSRSPRLLCA